MNALKLAAIILTASITSASAQQGLRVPNLDEYCKLKSVTARETAIYLDGSLIRAESAGEFATIVSQKLGLAPRERVRIFYVTSSSQAKEIFNKCWPELLPDELAPKGPSGFFDSLKYLLDEAPETKLKDTKDFFRLGIQNSIKNEASAVQIKEVDMVRLLSADRNRLEPSKLYRIFIFSSMNSAVMRDASSLALQPPNDESDRIDNLFREFPLNLHGAEMIVWGAVTDDQLPLRSAERYWTAYFQRGLSNLQSFAADLPIQHSIMVSNPISFSGTWRTLQAGGRASVSLASTLDGQLVSSWITIQASKQYAIPIEGTYECKGPKECQLKATVAKDAPYLKAKPFFREGDLIELSGDPGIKLIGSIKPPNPTSFPGGSPAIYTMELKKD